MKVPSRKVLIGIAVALTVIILLLIVIISRRRSRYEWPVTTPDAEDSALSAALASAQETYNREMIRISGLPAAQRPAAILAAENVFSAAITGATNTFVNGKCPDVITGTAPSTPTTPLPNETGKTFQDAWDDFQINIASIQDAYYTVLGSPAPATNEEVIAARKADISGATRKYIARICPSFYKPSVGTDPTPGYASWTYVASGTPPTVGLLKTNVTAANVSAWAEKAAKTAKTTAAATILGGETATGPLTVDDGTIFTAGKKVQLFLQAINDMTGAVTKTSVTGSVVSVTNNTVSITLDTVTPVGGVIIPVGTVIAVGLRPSSTTWVENWSRARDYGPGSVQPVA